MHPESSETQFSVGEPNEEETLLVFTTQEEAPNAKNLAPPLRVKTKLHPKATLCLAHSDVRNREAAVEAAGLSVEEGTWEQLHNATHVENFQKTHGSRANLECQVCNENIEDQPTLIARKAEEDAEETKRLLNETNRRQQRA